MAGGRRGERCGTAVDVESLLFERVRELAACLFHHHVEADVLIVAGLGFGSWGEEGFGQLTR